MTEARASPRRRAPSIAPPVPMLPLTIRSRLGSPKIVIGFDIETHALKPKSNRIRTGEFGWHLWGEGSFLDDLRIVQIGWVKGHSDTVEVDQSRSVLVQPDNFVISAGATGIHRITQAKAMASGRPLADALADFMRDIETECARGAVVCAHRR